MIIKILFAIYSMLFSKLILGADGIAIYGNVTQNIEANNMVQSVDKGVGIQEVGNIVGKVTIHGNINRNLNVSGMKQEVNCGYEQQRIGNIGGGNESIPGLELLSLGCKAVDTAGKVIDKLNPFD